MYFKTTKPKGRHPYLGHLSLAVSVQGLNAAVAKQLCILYGSNLLKNPQHKSSSESHALTSVSDNFGLDPDFVSFLIS